MKYIKKVLYAIFLLSSITILVLITLYNTFK